MTMSREQVLAGLRSLNVKTCMIYYSGGGDDGSITGVDVDGKALDQVEKETPPEKMIPIRVAGRLLGERVTSFEEAVTEWAYYALSEADIPDWVNNEGGAGIITIDVEAGTITADHNANLEGEYDEYDGDGELVTEGGTKNMVVSL